jgi:hypothetical protein
VLFEMRQDPIDIPAAAQVMPDHHVKGVTAVGPLRRSGTDDLLDLIKTVAVAATVETGAGSLGFLGC